MSNNSKDKLIYFAMASVVSIVLLFVGWNLGSSETKSQSFNPIRFLESRESRATKQLKGQWELVSLDGSQSSFFYFTEDGVLLEGSDEGKANEVGIYSVESDDQANYLFLMNDDHSLQDYDEENSDRKLAAIFTFSEDGSLIVESVFTDEPLDSLPAVPLSFSEAAMMYKQIAPAVPENLEVYSLEEQLKDQKNVSLQAGGKNNLGAILRVQQTIHLETNRFTSDWDDLKLGLPQETEGYSYKFTHIDPPNMVQVIAQPKNQGLKTYMGVAYELVGGGTRFIACESDGNTMELPPQVFMGGNGHYPCPSGYSSIR
jgi:hypothetical protein